MKRRFLASCFGLNWPKMCDGCNSRNSRCLISLSALVVTRVYFMYAASSILKSLTPIESRSAQHSCNYRWFLIWPFEKMFASLMTLICLRCLLLFFNRLNNKFLICQVCVDIMFTKIHWCWALLTTSLPSKVMGSVQICSSNWWPDTFLFTHARIFYQEVWWACGSWVRKCSLQLLQSFRWQSKLRKKQHLSFKKLQWHD